MLVWVCLCASTKQSLHQVQSGEHKMMKMFCWISHQRTCLVLCRHHDGHATHAGDVGSGDCGGGQWWWGGGSLWLAVGLRQHLSVGQLGVTLRSGEGAPAGAGLRGEGPARQTAVVVAVVGGGWGGGSVVVRVLVAGRPVASCAASGCDDGGSVWRRALGVLLQMVVVVVVVIQLFVVGAGGNGGQGAVLGDDVRAHSALCPGHTFRSLSVLPAGRDITLVYSTFSTLNFCCWRPHYNPLWCTAVFEHHFIQNVYTSLTWCHWPSRLRCLSSFWAQTTCRGRGGRWSQTPNPEWRPQSPLHCWLKAGIKEHVSLNAHFLPVLKDV